MKLQNQILEFLQWFAPLDLAESWDNVGLIVGDASAHVDAVMTCLTLTPDVAEEAIASGCQLIITHHPVLFRPIQKLTTETVEGSMLMELVRAGVSVYSPHTAFDSAFAGINQQLCESLGLKDIKPLRPTATDSSCDVSHEPSMGAGRFGQLETSVPFKQFLTTIKSALNIQNLQYIEDDLMRPVQTVAVACGAAGEFLTDALSNQCDLFLTGETRFHTCLEARTEKIALVLPGHYATERPAVEKLAEIIQAEFPHLEKCFASQCETDPVCWSC